MCIILELLSSLLSPFSPWFWKMLKQEVGLGGFQSNFPCTSHHLLAPALEGPGEPPGQTHGWGGGGAPL